MATEENTYFLRSFLLLVEGGLYISRETLERECQKAGGDLDTLLRQSENKLKYEFHGKQYDKLFPQYGTTDINKWDLQLSVGVLINIFGRSLSLTEKQKLRALRDLRNEIYMHCASASLDRQKYENVMEELEEIINTLAASFDTPVQDRCSKYITQFATGPLDGVKPSLATLNGLSQTCQKTFKVGLHTELVVGGPSDYWINLCEHTLDVILNKADSMASEDAEFEEIEKNVKKMLEFLQTDTNVVFKGSKKECVILMLECNSIVDVLLVLQKSDSQEFEGHLSRISDALLRHYQFDATIFISAKVKTECLQSILIEIIKMNNSEVIAQRHLEISSENEEDGHMAVSERPLKLFLDCTSKTGLLHFLNSFKNDDFSEHIKRVADALSTHFGTKITLKASLDINDVMAAIEEAVSRDSVRYTKLQHGLEVLDIHEDESELGTSQEGMIVREKKLDRRTPTSQNEQFRSESDEESIDRKKLRRRVCLIKSYAYLKYELSKETAEELAYYLFPDDETLNSAIQSVHTRRDAVELLLKQVMLGPNEIIENFIDFLRNNHYKHCAEMLEQILVTDIDVNEYLKVNSGKQENEKPRLEFSVNDFNTLKRHLDSPSIDEINDQMLSMCKFSIVQHRDVSKYFENYTMKVKCLMDNLQLCDEDVFEDFTQILISLGFDRLVEKLDKTRQKRKHLHLSESDSEPENDEQPLMHFKLHPGHNVVSLSGNPNDSNIQASLASLASQVQTIIGDFGIEKVEQGSIVIYLRPNNPEAWLSMEESCRTGKIKDFIPELFDHDQLPDGHVILQLSIYIEQTEGKERAIFVLQDSEEPAFTGVAIPGKSKYSGEEVQCNPIEECLCEELDIEHINDLLIELKRKKLVDDTFTEEITELPVRTTKANRLVKKIYSLGVNSISILKNYLKDKKEYLYQKLCEAETLAGDGIEKMSTGSEERQSRGRHRYSARRKIFFSCTVILQIKKNERVTRAHGRRVEITCPKISDRVCHFEKKGETSYSTASKEAQPTMQMEKRDIAHSGSEEETDLELSQMWKHEERKLPTGEHEDIIQDPEKRTTQEKS